MYETTLKEVLKWAGGEDHKLTPEDVVTLEWRGGYVVLETRGPSGNGDFRGSFHPNEVCEGGGICRFCGRTL